MRGFKGNVEERYEIAGINARGASLFTDAYRRWQSGLAKTIPWDEIGAPDEGELVEFDDLEGHGAEGLDRFGELVWIILNGGLGTSMEVTHAKSLLKVKGEENFLDLVMDFLSKVLSRTGKKIPLMLMNSPATRRDSLAAMEKYGDITGDERLPMDFLQNFFPRVVEEDGSLFGEPADAESWAPPGHGDLYEAIYGSGVLDKLLESGKRWAFISNADNMGAAPSPRLLGYISSRSIPFVMEVTARTEADVKGGTLV
ncbi:MAG: UTP--glucose-1-phosphate uridylyltransferase, partial [Deltaproteobacteria bacterium]